MNIIIPEDILLTIIIIIVKMFYNISKDLHKEKSWPHVVQYTKQGKWLMNSYQFLKYHFLYVLKIKEICQTFVNRLICALYGSTLLNQIGLCSQEVFFY